MDITKKETYYYNLPENLIAQYPVEPRDSSKLLVYNKKLNKVEHKIFTDIVDYLNEGDVLVVNNTKVIPVRLYGLKKETNAKIEVLLLKRLNLTNWEALIKPGKRLKLGQFVAFGEELTCEIVKDLEDGKKQVKFHYTGVFEDILNRVGKVPLPHYIKNENYDNIKRYNTVYAKTDGSSAAPTAGLHFTDELLAKIKDKGIKIVEVLLHVGLGTFRPVKETSILNHIMHTEYLEVSQETCDTVNTAKQNGNRIIAVGTTSVRVLESCAQENGVLLPQNKETNIFIYPGYKFKIVDAIITNFHLPESTLIMLISAYLGVEKTLELYNLAVEEKYRFFSFGDSMFLF